MNLIKRFVLVGAVMFGLAGMMVSSPAMATATPTPAATTGSSEDLSALGGRLGAQASGAASAGKTIAQAIGFIFVIVGLGGMAFRHKTNSPLGHSLWPLMIGACLLGITYIANVGTSSVTGSDADLSSIGIQ